MKKIISVVLLLTLCLGLFAGCDKAPAETTSDLANAKALVFNTYKPSSMNEVPAKSADFEVMTSALVAGVSYPVSWTVKVTEGPADAVKIVDGSSSDFKKVDVTEKPETLVKFTLTATISDKDGKTETVSFNYMTPAFEAPKADKIVILNVADKLYATGTEYLYTSSSGSTKMELVLDADKSKALAYTLINNDDGTVSFKTDGGLYLSCDATNVEFVTEASDFTKFVLEVADGGYFIKCAVANYNGKAQYLEIYDGYLTCYGMNDSKPGLYVFALEDAAGANGAVVEYKPTENPDPDPGENNDPAADSELSVKDAIALGAGKAHNTYTEGKYYVTGTITEIYNEQYGNMKITDAEGNILTIYGTYSADGTVRFDAMETKPVVGDKVKIYGIVGQYNDNPQIKNGWIVAIIAPDPAADSELTVAEAIALGSSKAHNTYTEGKYYVVGEIVEIYNEQYGNMKIKDAEGNILTIYGTYSADGTVRFDALEKKPAVGDTVKIYGIVGQYNGTPQIKNGWIIE